MNTGEKSPQDMAIWRAILAGDEWYALRFSHAPGLRQSLKWAYGCAGGPGVLRLPGGRAAFVGPGALPALRKAKRVWGPNARIIRLVYFIHPFTGGRAVYSESID